MSKHLKIKDFVTMGIFFVIYFAVFFGVGMIGLIPILFLCFPFVSGVINGTTVMLYMAKVPKPWSIFLFGMLGPLFMWTMGHTYIVPAVAVVFVGLAELCFRLGKFKSFKYIALSYAFFSCWIVGSLMQMLLVKERYIQMSLEVGMSPEYLDSLEKLISYPSMLLVTLGAFVGGLIGAFIGKKMLKKHFAKAGIL
ncbi:MAG: MptD family putative ECF transporter S component [Bacillota bacterium]|nr:MptD family putative ECF transporter S component [Bacillota bacterium]